MADSRDSRLLSQLSGVETSINYINDYLDELFKVRRIMILILALRLMANSSWHDQISIK